MFYIIYKITNKINGKIYIGKHQTSNIDEVKQYLSENQSDDLFIRIEDNQYVDIFSGKILKSTKYHQIIRL